MAKIFRVCACAVAIVCASESLGNETTVEQPHETEESWRSTITEKIQQCGESIFQAGVMIQAWLRSDRPAEIAQQLQDIASARLQQVSEKLGEVCASLPVERVQQKITELLEKLPCDAAQQKLTELRIRIPLEVAQQKFTELREQIPLEARSLAACAGAFLLVFVLVRRRRRAGSPVTTQLSEKVACTTEAVGTSASRPVMRATVAAPASQVARRRRTESPAPIGNENSEPNTPADELSLLAIINNGTAEELQAIKGLGHKTVATVMKYRGIHGDMTKLDDLVSKAGVSAMVLRRIVSSN